jgi:hypothetical protein
MSVLEHIGVSRFETLAENCDLGTNWDNFASCFFSQTGATPTNSTLGKKVEF